MRRPFRILLNALTVLSLVLAVGVAGVWVRSYWVDDILKVKLGAVHHVGLHVWRSDMGVFWNSYRNTPLPVWDGPWTSFRGSGRTDRLSAVFTHVGGFGYAFSRNGPDRYRAILVPAWALLAVCLVLPARAVWKRLRRRDEPGSIRCPACGYDLRATPERCPECGNVPAKVTQ